MKIKVLLVMIFCLSSCDPHHLEKCEWHLGPNRKHLDIAQENMVSLCARNHGTGKQKCFIQATLPFFKASYGKLFRFVDMELDSKTLPKTITHIEYCGQVEGFKP